MKQLALGGRNMITHFEFIALGGVCLEGKEEWNAVGRRVDRIGREDYACQEEANLDLQP